VGISVPPLHFRRATYGLSRNIGPSARRGVRPAGRMFPSRCELGREVLEVFAEAQRLVDWHAHEQAGGWEAARRRWRARQEARGLCVCCRRATVRGRYCDVHRRKRAEAQRRSRARGPRRLVVIVRYRTLEWRVRLGVVRAG
jgi:hypothetical protein